MASSSVPVREFPRGLPPAKSAGGLWSGTLVPLLPAILMLYSTLLPQEVRISIAGQEIYPYRAVTFVLLPWMLNRIVGGKFPFRMADLWVFVGVLWMLVSFIAFYGAAEGVGRGGALVLDIIAPYVVARLCIRDLTDLRRLLVAFAPGLLLAGLSMVAESVLHVQVVRPFAAKIFGGLAQYENGQAVGGAKEFNVVRLGLLRSSGPFAHPILAGVYMASFLPLYLNSGLRSWPRQWGVLAGYLSFFSVSSAAILSLVLTGILMGYDAVQRRVKEFGWPVFVLTGVLVLLIVQMVSESGVVHVLIRLTLDPATGFFRQLIWEYGTKSVARHPWIGIGFTDYERLPWMINSIDNHWLLLAIRHGIIVPAAFMGACVSAIFGLSVGSMGGGEAERRLRVAVAISLFVLVLSAFTTSYFGGMLTWFFMLIAVGISVGTRSTP